MRLILEAERITSVCLHLAPSRASLVLSRVEQINHPLVGKHKTHHPHSSQVSA
jgi:hypothetical protein